MINSFNIWEFLAGLGIFLLAMGLLETALEQLTGRSFKKFLRKHTNNPVKAILSGVFITSIFSTHSIR
ncbi:MAG: phosphate:Na+ symporter [Paraglaciecola sp.]|jgi:phosphate:Na+ symporter